jgi:hypothetical protein
MLRYKNIPLLMMIFSVDVFFWATIAYIIYR